MESATRNNIAKHIHVRTMQVEDVPQVAAIEKQSFPFPWGEQAFYDCLRVQFRAWVIEESQDSKKSIMGYAIAMCVLDESQLLNIAIAPEYQGQQLGYYLLKYILLELKAREIKHMFLEVRRSNQSAICLYKRLNFIEIGIRKNYYPTEVGREDAILFRLEL